MLPMPTILKLTGINVWVIVLAIKFFYITDISTKDQTKGWSGAERAAADFSL